MGKYYISATDIKNFCYCKLKWYYYAIYGKETIENLERQNKENFLNKIKNGEIIYKSSRLLQNENHLLKGKQHHETINKQIFYEDSSIIVKIIFIILSIFLTSFFWNRIDHLYDLIIFILLSFCIYKLLFFFKEKLFKSNHVAQLPLMEGEVVQLDNSERKDDGILFSEKYHLCGKPDHTQKLSNGNYCPVEEKHYDSKDDGYYEGDLMQLAVYFILIEENYGPCPTGIIRYKNNSYTIDNTEYLKKKLLNKLNEMKYCLRTKTPPILKYKPSFNKCKKCKCMYTLCLIHNRNHIKQL